MLDAGAHSGQISEQTGVVEVIAFAGSDRGCRRTILNDPLQSFELPLGGCQVFALCGRAATTLLAIASREARTTHTQLAVEWIRVAGMGGFPGQISNGVIVGKKACRGRKQ